MVLVQSLFMKELNDNKCVADLLDLGDLVNIEGGPFGFNGDGYTLFRKTPISLELMKKHVGNHFYYLRISIDGCSFIDNKLKVPSYCFLELDLKNEIPENKTVTKDPFNISLESEVLYHG